VTNPGWVNVVFAALMLSVATYSAGRLVASAVWRRPIHRDVDIAHVLMGVAMAGMLVSDVNPLPIGVWEVVFSVLAAWFVWRCYQFVTDHGAETYYHAYVHRLSRRVIHLVMSLAMLYMYLAASPGRATLGGSMAMGAASGTTADFALLPAVFVVLLLVSAIWQLDAIGRFSLVMARDADSSSVTGDAMPPDPRTGLQTRPTSTVEVRARPSENPAVGSPWLAPRLEATCHIVMAVTMAYMLILMV